MKTTRSIATLFLACALLSNQAFAAEAIAVTSRLPVTRAEFIKTMIDSLYPQEKINQCFRKLSPSRYTLLFTDVSIDESYAPELCVAMRLGIVQGYGDGSFHPNRPVNFAEAAKIITRSHLISPVAGLPDDAPWFARYVYALEERGAMPSSIGAFDQPMTMDLLDGILYRLEQNVTNLPSIGYDELRKKTEAKYQR